MMKLSGSLVMQGLLRRGLTVPALREFILAQGASKNVTYQEWDKIWSINKKVIDPVCPRHTVVKAAGKVPFRLTNVGGTEFVTLDRHSKHPAAGKKVTQRSPVSNGQAVRGCSPQACLKSWH